MSQVRELQKQLNKQMLTSEQELSISTHAQKDEVMQNINVLIKGAKKTREKAGVLRDQLENQLQQLELEIDNFKTQLAEVDGKERDMLKQHTPGHSTEAAE